MVHQQDTPLSRAAAADSPSLRIRVRLSATCSKAPSRLNLGGGAAGSPVPLRTEIGSMPRGGGELRQLELQSPAPERAWLAGRRGREQRERLGLRRNRVRNLAVLEVRLREDVQSIAVGAARFVSPRFGVAQR